MASGPLGEKVADYARILLEGRPLLDVRAPVEFAKGAFPGAVNLPLLDDSERERVGKTFKSQGHDAAVELGHELVAGEVRSSRLEAWVRFTEAHPDGFLYCFRGGERSQIVQRWLAEAGHPYPRIDGGYKAMRRWLIDETARLATDQTILLVAGRTGVGKTEVLPSASASVDLEGLANHRGSGFGRHATPQPSPIDFENRLAIEWLRLERAGHDRVVMEDESRCVGRCALPEPLWDRFQSAPLVVLDDDFEGRVARIRKEYVEDAVAEFEVCHPGAGFERLVEHLLASLDRIKRRLGGATHAELRGVMSAAFSEQRASGDASGHDAWIARLLTDYYDPMYDCQLEKKTARVTFSGNGAAVRRFLSEWSA